MQDRYNLLDTTSRFLIHLHVQSDLQSCGIKVMVFKSFLTYNNDQNNGYFRLAEVNYNNIPNNNKRREREKKRENFGRVGGDYIYISTTQSF